MTKFSGALALCLLVIGAGCDDQSQTALELKSAPDVREQLPGFDVTGITGPWSGHIICLCCRYGMRPVVVVFTRDLNDDVKDLVQKIDSKVGENQDKKMAAFVVVLTADADEFVPRIKALAKDAGISNVPLTIISAPTPPPEYKIADDAQVTVLMWVERVVKVNRSFATGELDKIAIDALVADTNKILE